MEENIIAAAGGLDEAEALVLIEHLDLAARHAVLRVFHDFNSDSTVEKIAAVVEKLDALQQSVASIPARSVARQTRWPLSSRALQRRRFSPFRSCRYPVHAQERAGAVRMQQTRLCRFGKLCMVEIGLKATK